MRLNVRNSILSYLRWVQYGYSTKIPLPSTIPKFQYTKIHHHYCIKKFGIPKNVLVRYRNGILPTQISYFQKKIQIKYYEETIFMAQANFMG